MVYIIIVWMAATGPYTQHGDAISIGPMKDDVCLKMDPKELASMYRAQGHIAPTEQLLEAGCFSEEKINTLGPFYGCRAHDHVDSVWVYTCDRYAGVP